MGWIPYQERLRLLAGAVYNAAEIGMWCFGPEYELIYSTCPYEKEFLMFLELGDCLEFVRRQKGGCSRPAILSDSRGLVWVAEHTYEEGNPCLLIIMGPVFLSSTSAKSIEDELRKLDFSISARKQLMRVLEKVPVVLPSMLTQYSSMLHYMITEDRVLPRDFLFQKTDVKPETDDYDEPDESMDTVDSDREIKGERLLLQAVREGNLNFMQVKEDEADFGGRLLSHTGDSIRDAKNTVLISCALCTRAALEGGLSPKTVKALEKRYISQIEQCDTLSRLTALYHDLLKECVQRVHDLHQSPDVSASVQECCDYIRANVLKPLSVESIAKEMGYTDYYFTKKFYKEKGIRLTDYIKEARIEYAKIALITTKKSIQDISDSLHFGTRNYFSKVFRDIVDVTPAAYRERMGGTIE